jgi:hypothetical protein
VFGEKVNPGRNLLFRLFSQAAQIIPALTDTQPRIRLLPDFFIKGIVTFI